MAKKERLDKVIQTRFAQYTRNQIQSYIMCGKVKVDGVVITKAGTPVSPDVPLEIADNADRYVCRAGFKLEALLEQCTIDVAGKVILDAGLSTGGFTDCLLQKGAAKVYGIDVGYGQVHEKIRQDPRVVIFERTNLRHVTSVGEKVDCVTLDLSFISVLKVMDAVRSVLKDDGILLVLIKPQFEASKEEVGKGGIIKDSAIHTKVVTQVVQGITECGFTLEHCIDSPITGTDGNKEFLAYFKRIMQ